MNWLGLGKKVLDKVPNAQYEKLNKLCDLIKFNYACRIKDEEELEAKVTDIVHHSIRGTTFTVDLVNKASVKEILTVCKEYYKK